jgi:predicted transcriptional regulator
MATPVSARHRLARIRIASKAKYNAVVAQPTISFDGLFSLSMVTLSPERHDVRWHWVKGHAGHAMNERADQLARDGLVAAREKAIRL